MNWRAATFSLVTIPIKFLVGRILLPALCLTHEIASRLVDCLLHVRCNNFCRNARSGNECDPPSRTRRMRCLFEWRCRKNRKLLNGGLYAHLTFGEDRGAAESDPWTRFVCHR